MKRVNLPLIGMFFVITASLALGGFFLQRYQVRRNAGNLISLARLRLSEGKVTEAISLYGRYVGFRPNDNAAYSEYAEAVLGRAQSQSATRNDMARAHATLETAVRKNPDDDALRGKLAKFELQVGLFTDSRDHLKLLHTKALAAQSSQPTGPATHSTTGSPDNTKTIGPLDRNAIDVMLAQSFLGTENFDEAASVASELIGFDLLTKAFDPEKKPATSPSDAYIMLAMILEDRLKDSASADRVLDELTRVNSDDPQTWIALAKRNAQRGDLKRAEENVTRAMELSLDKDKADPLLLRFEIARLAKDLELAETTLDKALVLFPDDERMYRSRALLAVQQQQPEKSLAVLRAGLDKLPGRPSLLLLLADAYLQQNNATDVAQIIQQLKDVVGESNPAVVLLEARLLMLQRNWLKAKEKLNFVRPLAVGADDMTRQIDLCLGQCFEQLGEFDEQLVANRRVLTDDPTSLAGRVGTATALIAAGKPDDALAELETVAAALPVERLVSLPQIWNPLLQLRIAAQMKLPTKSREWNRIDSLIDSLQQSEDISDTQLALIRADLLARKGEAEAANDFLSKQSKNNPLDSQLHAAIALLTLREKGVAEAQAVIDALPKELAVKPDILIIKAHIAARQPAERAAKELLEIEKQVEILADDESLQLKSTLASIQLSIGNRAAAEQLWRAILEKKPDELRVRVALFELARDEGNLEKAGKEAAEISSLAGEKSAQARLTQASLLVLGVRLSLQKKSAQDQAATELSDDDIRVFREARNLLIEAENDRPNWVPIQQLFAEVDGLMGDIPAAIEHLKRALRFGSGNPVIIRQLVSLLYASNRIGETQEVLSLLGPEGIEGFDHISAELEMRAGKYDAAVALAERSVSSDSENAGDLMWLGQLLSLSNKFDKATTILERVVDVAPEQPESWLCLFSHQLKAGHRKAAERVLERAAEKLPEPKRQLAVGQGNEMLGKFEEAEKNFLAACEIAPDDMMAARGLATFLVRRGRLNPARTELQRIVDFKSNKPAFVEAQIWARRALAEIMAKNEGYNALEKALSIVDLNVARDGRLPTEDVGLKISLLVDRPEPESWRKAVGLLELLADSQTLSTDQQLQLAQLRDKIGRWDECREGLVTLVASPAATPGLQVILIEKLIDHNELSSAQTWLTKLRAAAPNAQVVLALESRLALAENNRPVAVDAAKKLMPVGLVPLEQAGQLPIVAALMEDLGFAKAADKLLLEYAALSANGLPVRAEFLGRQKRLDEALELLDRSRDKMSLERLLQTAITVVRSQGTASAAVAADRIEPWFTKARREDPDSVGILLLLAELREMQGRSSDVEAIYRECLNRKDLPLGQVAIISNNLAFHLTRPETLPEAEKLIAAAIKELGPHPDLLDTRGMIYLLSGDSDHAVEDLQEAVLSPTPLKFLHLAIAQMAAKQTDVAKLSLLKAKKLGLKVIQLSPVDTVRLDRLEKALAIGAESVSPDA